MLPDVKERIRHEKKERLWYERQLGRKLHQREDGSAGWKHGTTGASGEWVEYLGGRVEKESACGLKRTFGKIKWRGWEFRAS